MRRYCEAGACHNEAEVRLIDAAYGSSNHNHAYCLNCAKKLEIDLNDSKVVVKIPRV